MNENTEITTPQEANPCQNEQSQSLLSFFRNEEGNGFVEKIIIIGLFVFIVAAGVKAIGGTAAKKIGEQNSTLGTEVGTKFGGGQ
jgi:hypothetical protein